MKVNKIGAVVVLFNPSHEELENIHSYCSTVDEVILIDNSLINNEETVKEIFCDDVSCKMKYIFNNENLGLCRGLNKGVHIASEDGCDWCFTNDSDSKFENDITSIYRKILLNENDDSIAVLGPQYFYDRRKLKKREGVYDVEWLMTSGNLVNVSIFENVGGFDERLFLDGLDVEFCLRLRKHGYRVLECREAVLIHQPGITKESRLPFYTLKYGWHEPVRYYYQVRADIFIDRNYKTKFAKRNLVVHFLKILLLFENKREYFKAFFQGISDAYAGNWGKYNKAIK